MNTSNEIKTEFDSTHILMFFVRWWKHFAIIAVAAALAGMIFSSPYFITPMYESTAVMFPSTSNSLSRAISGGHIDFLQYGDVADAERLLQVLGSAAIRDRVVERFNLYQHYDIPANFQYRKTHMRNAFVGNVTSKRTSYGAVEIKVRDKDPDMAARIANEMAALSDTIQNEMRRERALTAYNVARQIYDDLLREKTATEDTLRVLMSRGIYHYEHQSEMLTRQLAIDISSNNARGINALESRLEAMEQHGGEFLAQRAYLDQVSRNITIALRNLQETKADLESFVSFQYMLDEAYSSEKKSYPVRWLIVFFSVFAAMTISVVGLISYETLRNRGLI
jgi:uncharacterized protein involved in exopolysaccharide biosynthesis